MKWNKVEKGIKRPERDERVIVSLKGNKGKPPIIAYYDKPTRSFYQDVGFHFTPIKVAYWISLPPSFYD